MYQIYCDRGDGTLSLEGCWGSENAHYDNETDAIEGAKFLSQNYPDCDWVVAETDVPSGRPQSECHRIDSVRSAALWLNPRRASARDNQRAHR